MMSLPELQISEVPVTTDDKMRVTFCKDGEQFLHAAFALNISASDAEDWAITQIRFVEWKMVFVTNEKGEVVERIQVNRYRDLDEDFAREAADFFTKRYREALDEHVRSWVAIARERDAADARELVTVH